MKAEEKSSYYSDPSRSLLKQVFSLKRVIDKLKIEKELPRLFEYPEKRKEIMIEIWSHEKKREELIKKILSYDPEAFLLYAMHKVQEELLEGEEDPVIREKIREGINKKCAEILNWFYLGRGYEREINARMKMEALPNIEAPEWLGHFGEQSKKDTQRVLSREIEVLLEEAEEYYKRYDKNIGEPHIIDDCRG
jgi:hypothetical protein